MYAIFRDVGVRVSRSLLSSGACAVLAPFLAPGQGAVRVAYVVTNAVITGPL